MISFAFTTEQEAFRAELLRFAAAELAPRYLERAAVAEFPWDAHRQLAGLGVLGLGLPERLGGSGDPDPVTLGLATEALKAILKPLNYANLDEHAPFKGMGPTTTEFLARHIFQEMALKVSGGGLGPHASGLTKLRVTLGESHVARAWCEGPLA